MESKKYAWRLEECVAYHLALGALIDLAVDMELRDAAVRNHKRLERRVEYRNKCREFYMKKHAKKLDRHPGGKVSVARDPKTKQLLWKTDESPTLFTEDISALELKEVEVEIVMIDLADSMDLLNKGPESIKGSIARNCEFMFLNRPWDDEEELEFPDDLKEYAEEAEAREAAAEEAYEAAIEAAAEEKPKKKPRKQNKAA